MNLHAMEEKFVVYKSDTLYEPRCIIGEGARDACTRIGQEGEICQKDTKDAILTSYPGTDVRDDHWERCIVEILEFTEGMNGGVLIISVRGWPIAYHAAMQKNSSISVEG